MTGINSKTPNVKYRKEKIQRPGKVASSHSTNESVHSGDSSVGNVYFGPKTVKLPNGYVQSLPYSFAEPTMSELMRRSTVEHDDFATSLRKPAGLGQPHIIQSPFDLGYGMTVNLY